MVDNNQQQEKPQGFELIELLLGKVDSSTSNAVDQSFEARYQSLVDQIQSYLHSSEKPGFFPHRFLGSFSSVLDTKLNDKLGIKKLHFRFEGARTLKVVAETESKIHVFIFTEDIEAQHSKQTNTKNFEFTTGEWKNVMGRDYTKSDAHKLQIDVIKILKDKYELVKSKPKSDKDVKSKKLYLYLKRDGVLEYKAKNVYGNVKTIEVSRDQLKGKVFDEVKQFLGKQGKDLSDDARKELSRITSAKGYTLKSDGEDEKINIKVESKKKIVDQPIEPIVKFQEVTKRLGKSVYLESYIEKLANPDAEIDQVQENLKAILNYIKKIHTNLDLQANVYGIKAREADQHGFVAGIFDNFRYRDNTKLYLEQFAGGGYADIVLLVRGPNRAVDSVPILIELKAGTEGQIDPSDALEQAKDYIKGFRANKMRILTNADNAIAVGLNLDDAEPFKTEVKPIKRPPAPLMEEFIELIGKWDNQLAYEEVFKREVKDLLSSEYHTFPANKETKDHYYFSRDMLGQSILINKIGQDQSNIKKYIYSYGEYPLDWSGGTEYTLSKSPVMTLMFVQGNEGQENTAFIFHIRESNTKEFYADKKIPVLNIPGIGEVKNVIEIKMSLKKYETGLSFEELFEIEQISKYNPSGADQQFTGSFLKIPNSDELKVKFDQAITSQHASDGEVSLQAYKVLLSEVADAVYPIKDLITNEARLQAILNGLFSSYSDLKLQETSAKTVIIPEFQVGAGGRVDMVIQGIGPSPQGAKEYTPIALEFKLIGKNLNQDQLKQEVDKLTKEQNIRYAKGAALKAITDSDKMLFMGVVVNVKAKDKNSLILTSDKFVPALVVHSSIDIAKRKHLERIQEITQRLKNTGIQEENLRTLESATAERDYHYWLQQHDIADIARIKYGYGIDTLFEIVGSPEHIVNQLQQFQDRVTTRGERRPLTLIVNLDNNHWVTLVISHQNGQYNGYYVDSLGNNVPDNIRQVLQQAQITVNDVSVIQQRDGYNCGLWALENARDINTVLQGNRLSNIPDEIRNHLRIQRRENHFIRMREGISNTLSIDPQRIANLEAVLAGTQQPKFDLNSCVGGGRSRRSINPCLFSKGDVEEFSKGKVDGNNVDKIIVDSEKFLTYVKNSQDEAKNAQLIKFVGDKSIEGDYRYLVDRVVQEQGYERYIQNERVKDLYGGILQKDVGSTKNSKSKGRLINAAGRIQLIRGIHGTVVSCADGDSIDCGLSVSGMAWSFASQPIENVIVKTAPKIVKLAGQFVGKMVPGTLGRQAQFAVAFTGAKIGSKIAKGVGGAVGGIFDIIDISSSASNLVDCKKREDSDNPCGKKEIRDEIVSMSFSSVSFVAGVALTAAGMPVVGIAIGFALMVGQGVYGGVSNIIEYEEKYDTTHDENWRIFWHTFAFQPIPLDVQHLAERKEAVNSLAKEVWKMLNNAPDNVVAYGVGLGKVSGGTLRPDHATIMMNTERADIRSLSRVIPDDIEGADMICLPKITNQDYEKGITSFVPSAKHYCKNALIIADKSKSMKSNKTVVFDLRNVNFGNIVGSKKWNNNFLIFEGSEKIIGVSNIVNRFVLTNSRFVGQIIMGINSTNVFDLSQIEDSVVRVNPVDSIISTISQTLDYAKLEVGINQCITNYVNTIRYHYIGRHNKVDIVSCTTSTGDFIDCDTIIDSCGGNNDKQRDTIANCNKVVIAPYTDVLGKDGNYIFYVQSKGYKGKNLHSEIDVEGTGIVIFPENDLLNDCDNITYSSDTNTLSLRIVLGQNNRYTLDIKNYRKQGIIQPNFTLVDINGSNVVPKIREFGIRKINSFELHSEHSLDSLDNVKTHYKKIIGNNKSYEVFTVIRNKTQSQDDSKFQKMVFGSFGSDVINLDQGTIFAKGGEGSDLYFVSGDMDSEKVKIDNNSDDRSLDAISMPEVPEKFLMQGCDLYLDHNGTDIQVENYLKDNGYRHIAFVNDKGESFIPYIQSISCVGSSEENGKLVPFFHSTPTQNMFVLPKGFQGDSVVIDSRPEEIERYKDRDDLLLVREGGIPFIIKVENFYNDRGRWENVNFLLWNDGNFSPYSGLYQKVSEVMDYQDKLKSDYERSFKEYVVDFTQSVNITHNQDDTLTPVGQDKERIGIMILKDITPDRIMVSSSGRDLVFFDKVSKHVINVKNWSDSESYRISMLEFDLGLEPILIRRLDQFTLSNIEEIRNLVDKVSEICQSNAVCETNIEAENCNAQVSLHCAAASGQLDVVEKLVKELADVNVKDSTGWTPLHYAAANGKLNVVRYLIGKVASVDVRGDLEQTPLLLAVENGRLDVVKYLIEKGADVDVRNGLEQTPLHLAAGNGRLDVVKYLIEEKEADINIRDKFWITPLHLAASNGRLGVVKYLIEEKEADINIRDKFWITPLHLAASNGELDVVEYITEKGSSTNVRDQSRTSPLHLAASNGRLDVVKYLIEKGADVDIRNKFGAMPVHLAAKNGKLDVVEYIIREWGDFNAYDWLGRVPLHYAAEGGKLDMVKYIIEKGVNVNIKSKAREISLNVIDENDGLEELEYFTKKRADFNVEDDFGFTPLHLAAENGKLNVVRYLIEEKHADISIKDNLGRTPLSLADDMMYDDVVEYLEKELNERKEIPKQRNRRHHHGDHDRHHLSRKPRATDSINQPEIVASSGARSSSWINDLFGWVKSSVSGLLGSRSSTTTRSSISQVDAKMDVNGTIMLLDVLIRKVTGQKYISTADQSISQLEAQGYALNITEVFKKVIEQAALKSGISMHRLDIDYMGMQKEITRKVMSGKFDEISGVLSSYLEKACPSREAGCPGLSSKKFDKFMVEFNSRLNVVLNRSIQRTLHSGDGRLEVDGAKQMNLEPQSYLSNASVQGHSKDKVSTCLSEIGVTKLGGNLNR